MGRPPRPPREIALNLVASLLYPTLYALAVSLTLALYFTVRAGDIVLYPKMVRFVSMLFTPWFAVAYAVASHILPDHSVRRTSNLLLPALEAVVAVIVMSTVLSFGLEMQDPYLNVGVYLLELLFSVLLARLWVRRTFRH